MGGLMFTWRFAGNNGVQSDNAETGTIDETGQDQISFPYDVKVVDIVAEETGYTDLHQYQFFTPSGAKNPRWTDKQVDPNTQGRLNFAKFGIVIKAGTQIQIRGAQKTNGGAAAESNAVSVQLEVA